MVLIAIISICGAVIFTSANADTGSIPSWVKAIAGWWSEGKVADNEFVMAMQFLIDNQIIKVSNSTSNNTALINQLQNKVVMLQTNLDSANSEIASLKQQIAQLQPIQQQQPIPTTNNSTQSVDLGTEKGLAQAWASDKITDPQYISDLQSLIDQHKVLPYSESDYNNYIKQNPEGASASPYNGTFGAYNPDQPIPRWIKNEAIFWIKGDVSYEDYRQGISYLFHNGILRDPLS